MHHDACELRTLHVPSGDEARLAVEEARRMFRCALPGWASDMLCANRAGLTHIGWHAVGDRTSWRQAA